MRKIVLFIVTFFAFMCTNAALISSDDINFGAGAITVDTTNGMEWLDLTFSKGFSYNELSTEIMSGGLFSGFRIATFEEIQLLFTEADLPTIGSLTTDFAAVDALINLIGFTTQQGPYLEVLGISGTPGIGSGYEVTGLDFINMGGTPTYSLRDNLTYAENFGPDSVGGWLVKDFSVEVPEPASLYLLLFGLLGVYTLQKRRL